MRTLRVICVAALGVFLLACGGDGNGGGGDEDSGGQPAGDTGNEPSGDSSSPQEDDATPAEEDSGQNGLLSYYTLKLRLEMGPGITCDEAEQVECLGGVKTCCKVIFTRDLTGKDNKFSFGSTHIAPAVAFTMSDNIALPFSVVTLNFGIIIGTADKPPSTPTSGEYPFSGFEPAIRVDIKNKTFDSTIDGSEGMFNITDWTADEDGIWAGDFAGVIVQETEKPDKLRAEVEGEFHFILPKPQGGQPG